MLFASHLKTSPHRCLQRLPALVTGEYVGVARREHVGVDGCVHRRLHLCRTRPDVREEDGLPVGSHPEWLGREVDVHRAGEGVGHDERRRREVVHLDLGADPALEVAVAAEHGHDREIGPVDGGAHLGDQRTGVADADRAAVADHVEAELVEVGRQARLVVVVRDDLRAGAHRGLDPGLAREALLNGLLGQQARAEHHRRVGGVGARGDGSYGDGTVPDLDGHSPDRRGDGCRRILRVCLKGGLEGRLRLAQQHAVLRSLGPGEGRHDRAQVELDVLRVHRLVGRVVPEALLLGIRLHEGNLLVATPGEPKVVEGGIVDREDGRGAPVLRAHVADGRAIGERHRCDALDRRTPRTCRPPRACAASR